MKRWLRRMLLLLGIVVVPNVFGDVLLNYMPQGQIWGPGAAVPHACKVYGGNAEEQYAVKYVAEENWHVTKASYYAEEQGNYGSTFYVYMNVVHGGSSPSTGTVIATSANVDVNSWGTGASFHQFDFSSGFPMIQGDTYWFVVRAYSDISGTNCGTGSRLRSYVTIENNHLKTDSYYSANNGSTWTLDYGTTVEAPLRLEGVVTLYLGAPLNGTLTVSGGYHFGDDWEVSGTKCPADPGGVWKKHTGSDFVASVADDVFATEAGVIKHKEHHSDQYNDWAYHIVIEHTHPNGWKYTTVYWHVDPVEGLEVNDTVTKGEHIADVADIDGDHLHFGVWIGDYVTYGVNGPAVGALPVEDCSPWPAFPGGFVSPEDSNHVQFE